MAITTANAINHHQSASCPEAATNHKSSRPILFNCVPPDRMRASAVSRALYVAALRCTRNAPLRNVPSGVASRADLQRQAPLPSRPSPLLSPPRGQLLETVPAPRGLTGERPHQRGQPALDRCALGLGTRPLSWPLRDAFRGLAKGDIDQPEPMFVAGDLTSPPPTATCVVCFSQAWAPPFATSQFLSDLQSATESPVCSPGGDGAATRLGRSAGACGVAAETGSVYIAGYTLEVGHDQYRTAKGDQELP